MPLTVALPDATVARMRAAAEYRNMPAGKLLMKWIERGLLEDEPPLLVTEISIIEEDEPVGAA